jgi:CRP-like cAMP-binding protein
MDIIQVLSSSQLFSRSGPDELESLARTLKLVRLKPGQVLYTPHQQCRAVTLVSEGLLEISRDLPSAQRVILRYVRPLESFGEAVCQTHSRYPGWIQAVESSAILEIPYSHILKLCESQSFLRHYLFGLGRHMEENLHHIECLSARSITQKVACYLLYHDQSSITVTHMAEYLGCARESVSRVVSQFSSCGWIAKERGVITVCDRDQLELQAYGN